MCEVDVFLMRVTQELDDWPESYRARRWVALDEAHRIADARFPRELLRQLAEAIRSATDAPSV